MEKVLLTSFWIGLSGAALTVILRSAPGLKSLVQAGKKPWACDVCMSLWTTLFCMAFLWRLQGASWLAFPPAYAIAKWAVGRLMDPTHFPSFDLSRDDDEESPAAAALPPVGKNAPALQEKSWTSLSRPYSLVEKEQSHGT